jgi:hypothetical protein
MGDTTNRRSSYAARIEAELAAMRAASRCEVGRARMHEIPGLDVRHVEAYMRAGHPTLDGLSASEFRAEVRFALLCVEAAGPRAAEDLARSYAL